MLASVQLNVEVPPLDLVLQPVHQHVDEGGRITLTCTAVQVCVQDKCLFLRVNNFGLHYTFRIILDMCIVLKYLRIFSEKNLC